MSVNFIEMSLLLMYKPHATNNIFVSFKVLYKKYLACFSPKTQYNIIGGNEFSSWWAVLPILLWLKITESFAFHIRSNITHFQNAHRKCLTKNRHIPSRCSCERTPMRQASYYAVLQPCIVSSTPSRVWWLSGRLVPHRKIAFHVSDSLPELSCQFWLEYPIIKQNRIC